MSEKAVAACEFCGEQSPAYTYRLLPAKKMPRKSLRIYHTTEFRLNPSAYHFQHQSPFAKHIHRLALRTNVVSIKCGTCTMSTSIKSQKPFPPTIHVKTPKSKKNRKRKMGSTNDKDAGLIIPPSLRSTGSTPVVQPPPQKRGKPSQLFTNQQSIVEKLPMPKVKTGRRTKSELRPSTREMMGALQRHIKKSKEQRRKELRQLKKIVAKSKGIQGSGSSSLGAFLGD